MVVIVIDFGGTFIKLALIEEGILLDQCSIPAHSVVGIIPHLEEVETSIRTMLQRNRISVANCSGIGIAIPGIVNPDTRRVISTNAKYDDAISFDFVGWADRTFGMPIILENDANAALLGEVTYGSAKGETDAVLVTFGTGIGTAVIISGHILRGKHHQAGCLGGHITTNLHGNRCTCGNIGCVEANAGNWSLPDTAKKYKGFEHSLLSSCAIIDYKAVIESSLQNDTVAIRLFQELITHWSTGIVNMVHAYDPEAVILSGGLMKSKDLLLPYLKDRVYDRAWTPWGKLRFIVAEYPEASVLYGLYHLFSEKNFGREVEQVEKKVDFKIGLDVIVQEEPLGFVYGEGVHGPEVERRRLDAIRSSLRNPHCDGPETVYAIAMDVAKKEHKELLKRKMLLFGIVTYASGKLGDEPIRSQGHIHKVSEHSGWSPPEVYEIWSGSAYIFMQEHAANQPGRCFAVHAKPGEVVVVPPYWAHATVSADPKQALTFGAWCDREYGFEYEDVRQRQGLAWYPSVNESNEIVWNRNQNYLPSELVVKRPNDYSFLGIQKGKSIYKQFEENPETFQFVSKPGMKGRDWIGFTP